MVTGKVTHVQQDQILGPTEDRHLLWVPGQVAPCLSPSIKKKQWDPKEWVCRGSWGLRRPLFPLYWCPHSRVLP